MGCCQSTEQGVVYNTGEYQQRYPPGPVPSLTVIVVHYNPQSFKRRAELVNQCLKRLQATQRRIKDVDLKILAVELTYGHNGSEIPDLDGVRVRRLAVDAKQIMWSKEQLINIAINEVDQDTKYIAWIDSDIEFTDDLWVSKTIRTLQDHPLSFAQMWSTCDMLGPDGKKQKGMTFNSFAQQRASGRTYISCSNRQVKDYWHPGFAWAATAQALRLTDNLIDKTLGSADRHMAMSFLGRAAETVPDNIQGGYRDQVMEWQRKVMHNKIQLAVVQGHIKHHWHGSLKHRQYMGRWDLLAKHRFDPNKHLKYNKRTKLYDWDEDECPLELIQEIIEYFQNRQEDSSESSDSDESIHQGGSNWIIPGGNEDVENGGSSSDDNGSHGGGGGGDNGIGTSMDFYG